MSAPSEYPWEEPGEPVPELGPVLAGEPVPGEELAGAEDDSPWMMFPPSLEEAETWIFRGLARSLTGM